MAARLCRAAHFVSYGVSRFAAHLSPFGVLMCFAWKVFHVSREDAAHNVLQWQPQNVVRRHWLVWPQIELRTSLGYMSVILVGET